MHKNTYKQRGNKGSIKSDRADQRPRSNNPDFRQLVKIADKFMACMHHQDNWENLPKGIANNIEKLISSIHLPRIENDQRLYEKAIKEVQTAVLDMGVDHLGELRAQLSDRMTTINNTDAKWAVSIAAARMRRRYGKKITEDKMKLFADIALDEIEYAQKNLSEIFQSSDESDADESPIRTTDRSE